MTILRHLLQVLEAIAFSSRVRRSKMSLMISSEMDSTFDGICLERERLRSGGAIGHFCSESLSLDSSWVELEYLLYDSEECTWKKKKKKK